MVTREVKRDDQCVAFKNCITKNMMVFFVLCAAYGSTKNVEALVVNIVTIVLRFKCR